MSFDNKQIKRMEKTIKQVNKEQPLDLDIDNMTLEQLDKLEQDLVDTENDIINKHKELNELQKIVIESLRIKIKKRKMENTHNKKLCKFCGSDKLVDTTIVDINITFCDVCKMEV